jgi:hypothetical protein
MKKTYNMNETQIRWSIKDAAAVNGIFTQKIKTNGPAVANHPKFGAAGGKLCNGPPGRARSPGRYISVRDTTKTEPTSISQNIRPMPENYYHTEYQLVINKNKNHFLQTFNFKIMKKQILIIAFFVVAMIASSLSSFGQMLPSSVGATPRTGTCTSDALHPKAGQSYPYTVAIGNGEPVAADGYKWWITKNPEFIVPGSVPPAVSVPQMTGKLGISATQLIATTANGATDGPSIDITWSPAILAATDYQGDPTNWATASALNKTPTFVAVMATGDCNNNVQIYEIDPTPSFTVDIANIDPATKATKTDWANQDVEQCVDNVRGATYSAAKEITMDYGTNTLYFEVISANFVTSWKPTFQIIAGSLSTVAGREQTADISWYYDMTNAQAGTNAIGTHAGLADGAIVGGAAETALVTASTNTSAGVSIFVKVVVHNQKHETIALNQFTLAVDGQDATNQWDLVNADCTTPAGADINDVATHDITPRPQINNALAPVPATTPDTFIPKN